jgi:hypothetical protein
MVPFKFQESLQRFVIKLFLVICLTFTAAVHTQGNPIEIKVIMEIYFDSGDWMIEMVFDEAFGIENLDEARLAGLYDTALFLPGFNFEPGEVIYVTQADLQSEFTMNQSGDKVQIHVLYGEYWAGLDEMSFGLEQFYSCEVSAPVGEESIAVQTFIYPGSGSFFWTAKELPNTIGSNPGEVLKRGNFSGNVKDKNYEPLEGVKLYYCPDYMHYFTYPTVPEIITDQNGYFVTDNMFCKKYDISFNINNDALADTVIFIEPDSANYFEFILDTLITGVQESTPINPNYSITNHPNPFSQSTAFIIKSEISDAGQKGVIKIFNIEDYIVDIIPVQISQGIQEIRYQPTNNSLSAGMYFYQLEIAHKEIASGKMMIAK